MDHIQKIVWV